MAETADFTEKPQKCILPNLQLITFKKNPQRRGCLMKFKDQLLFSKIISFTLHF